MLKKIGFAAATMAAGAILSGGVASADTPDGDHDGGYDYSGQVGLVNVNNFDLLHNVNAVVGACDNNVNVLGVQVPIQDSLNGIGVPILSPGEHEASGDSPSNCAAGGVLDGGTAQHN
ncbi:hypothetical protein BS329_09305 [Amycolatopsis coloradensis]|uniref:RdlA protein n=1 Tax=Amycolatopsis coloradensis TaxID=76021 RepID=A0A1R0KZB7_9PSEU|nr:hypothetical protein [Amycolatopsis coloradensis]OLZ54687.1 hypothetical protein BS329_09305 [Amycolatopsis coloradensis]